MEDKCVSCAGNELSRVLKAYKIACLNYHASPVPYKGKQIARGDMLKALSILISKQINVTKRNVIFKQVSDPLSPSKMPDLSMTEKSGLDSTQNQTGFRSILQKPFALSPGREEHSTIKNSFVLSP